jgi:hypothetical protein
MQLTRRDFVTTMAASGLVWNPIAAAAGLTTDY